MEHDLMIISCMQAGIAFVSHMGFELSNTTLIHIIQVNGLIFSSYGFFLRLQTPEGDGNGTGKNGSNEPSLWQIGLAGAGSGVMASYVWSRRASHLGVVD